MNALRLFGTAALFVLCTAAPGCAPKKIVPAGDAVPVVATTTILVDFVRAVGGTHVSVRSIVPVGASVEAYEPSPQDIAAVHDARLLVENGAGLETWLRGLIDNAKAEVLTETVASAGLPLIDHNPHLWMDPVAAERYIATIRDALIRIDPLHRRDYVANAARYDARLRRLTTMIRSKLAVIPRKRRIMLVYHDAWRYYGRRFGIMTAGAIEQAPGREAAASEIAHLIDVARADGIAVVFSEPEESSRLADALASGLPNGRVVPLYVDSVGTLPAVSEYTAMVTYDTDQIVAALRS